MVSVEFKSVRPRCLYFGCARRGTKSTPSVSDQEFAVDVQERPTTCHRHEGRNQEPKPPQARPTALRAQGKSGIQRRDRFHFRRHRPGGDVITMLWIGDVSFDDENSALSLGKLETIYILE